jgi:hypothetical protein
MQHIDLSLSGSGFGDHLDALIAGVDGHNAGTVEDRKRIVEDITVSAKSIGELLSGPKDSVMMFGRDHSCGGQAAFQIDMSTGEDPLDLLAREVHARNKPRDRFLPLGQNTSSEDPWDISDIVLNPFDLTDFPCMLSIGDRSDMEVLSPENGGEDHRKELAIRCRDELNSLRMQDGIVPCRLELHNQLDMFLDVAAKGMQNASMDTSCVDVDDLQIKKLRARVAKQEDEIDSLKQRMEEVEREKLEAMYARDEVQADLEVTQLSLWTCEQQKERLEDDVRELSDGNEAYRSGLAEVNAKMAEQEEEHSREKEATLQEVRQLRGERQALQLLSSSELTVLTETLMESLLRVQRVQQLRLQDKVDEQLCAVCLTERKNVVLQPCNHLIMCASCFNKCSSTCPQCRAAVAGHLIVYS